MEGYDKLFLFIPLNPEQQAPNQKSSPERIFVGESLGSQLLVLRFVFLDLPKDF